MLMRTFLATVFLCVPVMQASGAQDWEPNRRFRHRDGVQIRVGRNYHLPADQIATWPIIVVGGSATIDGRVEDDIVVIGGRVQIGPTAQVRANVVSLGGEVQVADTAEVSGEVHDISVLWPEIEFVLRDWFLNVDRGWWAAFRLTGTIFRYTLTLFAACLLTLVAPRWVRRIQDRVADAPLGAGFVGLASEILMVPMFLIVIAGLVLTIVGIPLLLLVPFAVLAVIVSWLAGFASVAAQLGGLFRMRSRVHTRETPVVDVACGVTLLFILPLASDLFAFGPLFFWPIATALGLAGFVLEYLAWTIGLGAVLLAPLHRRWQVGPPPVPSAVPPPSPGYGTTSA